LSGSIAKAIARNRFRLQRDLIHTLLDLCLATWVGKAVLCEGRLDNGTTSLLNMGE
jgi:hypothetical protein